MAGLPACNLLVIQVRLLTAMVGGLCAGYGKVYERNEHSRLDDHSTMLTNILPMAGPRLAVMHLSAKSGRG